MSLDIELVVGRLPDNEQLKQFAEIIADLSKKVVALEKLYDSLRPESVFSCSITHNLNTMAEAAGIYWCIWHPDELGITKATDMIELLKAGLALLQSDPERCKTFTPENNWGSYEGLVRTVTKYLQACEEHPEATVEVSR